ncbi:dipeptide/oligopeptide/nickel ABC transporter ATP-binding protein [Brevibacillus reuszeri]|uniref:Dipeptide/oligopeptide/nickel ABC transporter ATP-binding protein n=1 Tax=Brevibacillus reuszeri TaxID=54915 RepID=A0A0K9YUH7_9BACL|nr:ABC transporter ATP-binding protein [Brevibacillus reuszeri]KNB72364.1 peptide ABC transporter ATP-binding protein [Brevibacillus reuszeri]MED1860978.1 ABC transporter ATP-binding protein [Brevibacillus reuszeri]GED70509.1 dipeptide/oligopeptide/nickel ABC transporter ATP-binding protein [Brevibacillus reuszeri]
MGKESPLLEVKQLQTHIKTANGIVKAVNGIDLTVYAGETLGIVGESGCGKSITSLSMMGLLPKPMAYIESGRIVFGGRDITQLSEKEMRKLRGNEISMIFQEPMTSLNPVFTIGQQLSEPLKQHTRLSKKEIRYKIIEMLKSVGIPRAEQIIDEYPHQLSGGMRQRAMISLAMLCEPKLLIADEPTTALDVTIQAQILQLMKEIKQQKRMSILLITHDLGVVAEMCDRVVVMYAGQVVENADVRTIFHLPKHPYTRGLLASMPNANERKGELKSIPGSVPRPDELPQGCTFAPRCPQVIDRCLEERPPLLSLPHQSCRCWLYVREHQEVAAHAT